jgi:hypothetical protein
MAEQPAVPARRTSAARSVRRRSIDAPETQEVVRLDGQAAGVDRRTAAPGAGQDFDHLLGAERVLEADEFVLAGAEVGEGIGAEIALVLPEVSTLDFATGVLPDEDGNAPEPDVVAIPLHDRVGAVLARTDVEHQVGMEDRIVRLDDPARGGGDRGTVA